MFALRPRCGMQLPAYLDSAGHLKIPEADGLGRGLQDTSLLSSSLKGRMLKFFRPESQTQSSWVVTGLAQVLTIKKKVLINV